MTFGVTTTTTVSSGIGVSVDVAGALGKTVTCDCNARCGVTTGELVVPLSQATSVSKVSGMKKISFFRFKCIGKWLLVIGYWLSEA